MGNWGNFTQEMGEKDYFVVKLSACTLYIQWYTSLYHGYIWHTDKPISGVFEFTEALW